MVGSTNISVSTHVIDAHDNAIHTEHGVSQVAQTLSPAHIEHDADAKSSSGPYIVKSSSAAKSDEFPEQASMPGAHAGLKPWPDIHSPNRDDPLLLNSFEPTDTASFPQFSRPSPIDQATSTPEHSYYDSAHQPLSVSQQTSASAVRDMALRKGSPAVLRKTERPIEQRPLKSALKPFTSKRGETTPLPPLASPVMSPASQSKDWLRFPRWNSRLTRTDSSFTDRSGVFSPVSRTASGTSSGHSDRQGTPHTVRNKRSIGWDRPLQQYDDARNSSVNSDVSDRVRQAKLADGDVYEQAKMNIRRPPKGIKNWFDGFEISSDDDDATPLADPAQSTVQQFQHNGRQQQSKKDTHRSTHEKGNKPSKVERMLGHSVPDTRSDHDSFHDRLVPSETDRYRIGADDYFQFAEGNIPPKAQQQSFRNNGYPASHHTSSNSHGSSYNEHSTDRSDQYYRISDHYSSNSDAKLSHATPVNVHRPAIPPRRMHNVHGNAYNERQTQQRPPLDSYPSTSSRPPLPSYRSGSKVSSRSRRTYDDEEGVDDQMSTFTPYNTASNSSTATMNRSRTSARKPSLHRASNSTGGVPISGLSADIQHMMAVTEEEMALLEMMRNKRAAMNKPSYTKEYRRALEREREQLMQRRLLAQQTALQILHNQQDLYARRDEIDDTNETTDGEVDEHEIMRLDKLRQEELDRTLRLEKFLGANASLVAAMQETGMHLVESSHEHSQRAPGADSGRPRVTSRTPSTQHDSGLARTGSYTERRGVQGEDDADVDDEYPAPLDFPSPPTVGEGRGVYGERTKKNRSNLKSSRYLATLEEERLSAAFERAQRKSRSILADYSGGEPHLQQDSQRMRSQRQNRSHASSERSRKNGAAPTFLRSISDHQSAVDHRSITSRATSMNTGVVSPLTPSSLEPREADKRSSFGALDSEDDLQSPGNNLSSPEMNFSKPSRGLPPPMMAERKKSTKQTSTLASIADEDRRKNVRDSLASNGSAGEDVLAAWAELGGAEGILPGRRSRAR